MKLSLLNIIMLQLILINLINAGLFNNIIRSKQKVILGGYQVKPSFKYRFMVSIQYKNRHSCGGVLIRHNKVLTAAHCNFGSNSQFSIIYHRHDLSKSLSEEKGLSFDVVKRVDHPEYNEAATGNDVSVWTIKTSKGFEDHYSSYSMNLRIDDDSISNQEDIKLKAIGWGRTQDEEKNSNILLETILPVLNFNTCYNNYKNLTSLELNRSSQFCAGYFDDRGKDTCSGDSGGPLFYEANNKHYFVGIISYGVGCAIPNLPGVYTNIYGLRKFIDTELND
ncbi:trypsin-like serine protease [Neoconidiobolus thromboides FSU 785]|nr:trypsin-like serine protease [Neoconidiobolus thromboides FSU 785]